MYNTFLVEHGQHFVRIWNRTSSSITIIGSINCSRQSFMQPGQNGAICSFGRLRKHGSFESSAMKSGFARMFPWSTGCSQSTFILFVENVTGRNIVVGNLTAEIGHIETKFIPWTKDWPWCRLGNRNKRTHSCAKIGFLFLPRKGISFRQIHFVQHSKLSVVNLQNDIIEEKISLRLPYVFSKVCQE